MSITREAYEFTKNYIGLTEIKGPQDNRMIEVAHRLCKVEGPKGAPSTDEIPWCSAWVVLAIVCANIKRNPALAYEMLKNKGFEEILIKECFAYAFVSWADRTRNTLAPVVPPTWSASSKSWDKWGEPVLTAKAQRGDLVRLTRDGGGHIAFLDDDAIKYPTMTLLGGNQSNKVCSSSSYSPARVVCVRRVTEADMAPIAQPPLAEVPIPPQKVATSPSWFVKFKGAIKKLFKA